MANIVVGIMMTHLNAGGINMRTSLKESHWLHNLTLFISMAF
jgi:hypothetical protein